MHRDENLIRHFQSIAQHINTGGIYVLDVGLQPSLETKTQVCQLEDLVWAMEVEGMYVEASSIRKWILKVYNWSI
jgi:hypothetical protein